jgi:hypothetical protein
MPCNPTVFAVCQRLKQQPPRRVMKQRKVRQ